jgi:hypothetical protein
MIAEAHEITVVPAERTAPLADGAARGRRRGLRAHDGGQGDQ